MSHGGRTYIALAATGLLMISGAASAAPGDQEERRSTPVAGPVKSVVVDAGVGSVSVRQGSKALVEVLSRWTRDKPEVTVTNDRGVLRVTTRCPGLVNGPAVFIGGLGTCSTDIVVTVTARDAATTVDVSGDVTLAGLRGAHDLDSGTGDVLVSGTSGAALKVKTSGGTATIRSATTDVAQLDSSTGNTVIEKLTVARQLAVETSGGRVSLRDVRAARLSLDSSTGTSTLARVTVTGELAAQTSGGGLSLVDSRAGRLTLDSSTGDTDLSRVTATAVDIVTSGGRVTVDRLTTEILTMDASTGDVLIAGSRTPTLQVQTSGGDVTVKATKATDLDIDSSTGRIELDLPDAPIRLRGRTSGGDATVVVPQGRYRLELDGDQVFFDRVTADSSAPRSIELATSTGDIHLTGR